MSRRETYLDWNATAPLRPAAAAAMAEALSHCGNPSSVHRWGREARRRVEAAREAVAALVGAPADSVVFTSGGTEANHLARRAPKIWKLASAVEHSSVLETPSHGDPLLVDGDGIVDLDRLRRRLVERDGEQMLLVSVMLANNETGVIQPVRQIADLVHAHRGVFHCDAVQATGKIPVSLAETGADLLTLSAHKIGGPAGVGALIVADGTPITPLLRGGGQERNRRAGTENLAGIAGFAAAAAACDITEYARVRDLRGRLEAALPDAVLIAAGAPRLPNTAAIAMRGVPAETQIIALDLDGVMVSAGAACSSGKVGPSHVLAAMGVAPEIANSTIRVSLGWSTTEADIAHFVDAWTALYPADKRAGQSRMNDLTPNSLPIYLDNQASTPVDPRVLEAMLPYFTIDYGNPHSESHVYGHRAMAAIAAARGDIAALIHADPREIVFTSGATEANNLALKGVARFVREHPTEGISRDHIVTLATEHKCVLESCAALEREGFRVTYLPVAESGLVSLDTLAAALTGQTLIVSVMAAHNEIGVIQPLAEIGALCRSRGALFHTDAAQAVGKIPLDVEAMKIDLMSMSGHKLYGPKGVGALYIRRRPRVRLVPLIDGGGQERGVRSGTLPTPLCVGFGKACALARDEMTGEAARLKRLRERLRENLARRIPGVAVNGDLDRRLPGSLNISVPGTTAPAMIEACASIAISTGSACTSASVEPSYVLRALGLSDDRANASIRLGLGRFTTEADVDYAADAIAAAAARLRVQSGEAGPT